MRPEASPSRDAIYLDHAATTPLRPEVAEAMRQAEAEAFANPSSLHGFGRLAKRRLEDSRERILALVAARTGGRDRDRFVFTSGATEANRLAVLGLAGQAAGICRYSARDHRSVAAAAGELACRGWDVAALTLGADGGLDPDGPWLSGSSPTDRGRRILCVALVCGQTGVRQNMLRVAAARAAAPDLIVHVDATQAFSPGSCDFSSLNAATLALAPHKFGGPRGIGGLVVRAGLPMQPLAAGPQEGGLRGGTEPVALAVGFARALELASAEAAGEERRVAALRDLFEHLLATAAADAGLAAVVVGSPAARAPQITTIAFPGVDRQALVMAADLEGVACATGTACASGSSEPAPALVAMGLPAAIVQSAVRFSLGRGTTEHDIEAAVARLRIVLARAAAGRPGR